MNSRERVVVALNRKTPDRVPVLEFVIEEKVARAAVPGCRDAADCMDQRRQGESRTPSYYGKEEP